MKLGKSPIQMALLAALAGAAISLTPSTAVAQNAPGWHAPAHVVAAAPHVSAPVAHNDMHGGGSGGGIDWGAVNARNNAIAHGGGYNHGGGGGGTVINAGVVIGGGGVVVGGGNGGNGVVVGGGNGGNCGGGINWNAVDARNNAIANAAVMQSQGVTVIPVSGPCLRSPGYTYGSPAPVVGVNVGVANGHVGVGVGVSTPNFSAGVSFGH